MGSLRSWRIGFLSRWAVRHGYLLWLEELNRQGRSHFLSAIVVARLRVFHCVNTTGGRKDLSSFLFFMKHFFCFSAYCFETDELVDEIKFRANIRLAEAMFVPFKNYYYDCRCEGLTPTAPNLKFSSWEVGTIGL